ncbi:fungal hydrophobin domain-containing protein [Fusarium pseudocircinatum]|uniref:Hydrophobin n=1 Tax=Fusarium pseudocircinatum TaxID=56676 RepID=A0A8H5USJ9_9HYPO|nr:fungal hydrophobin domain-containing protein [Fusarium pseudocircinatum]
MHFITIITVFIYAAAALSFKGWRKPRVELLKVSEAQAVCGPAASVRCCNGKAGNANGKKKGGLLGLSSKNSKSDNNCVDLSLNVIGILDGTLGRKCSGNVVCCRDFPFADITGPINDGRPCIDLSNLL